MFETFVSVILYWKISFFLPLFVNNQKVQVIEVKTISAEKLLYLVQSLEDSTENMERKKMKNKI